LELQVICQDIFGNTAAVSISFKIDNEENEFLSTLGFGVDNPLFALNLRNNEIIKFDEKLFSGKLDIGRYVNKTIHYVSYMGSLTSPPCTQNVQWFVLLQKMSVSQTQLEYFPVLYGKDENVRGLQPLDGRTLWII
jgi:carbonic anhydrase